LIPIAFLQEWSAKAPWPDSRQVEQDLIISRALCDLFNAPALKDKIAFRGGAALNKLLFAKPLRYSEDIDLVQLRADPTGQSSMPFVMRYRGLAPASDCRQAIRSTRRSASHPKLTRPGN
jgi:hypothetical protein